MQRVTTINGRYAMSELLGGGGMARVFLARDGVLERDVAVKVLRGQYAENGELVERFRREALGVALPSEHRSGLRPGCFGRRALLHGHEVRARRDPQGSHLPGRAPAPGHRLGRGRPDRRRPGRRPRAGPDPQGREAAERARECLGRREGGRLRHSAGRGGGGDLQHERGPRHGKVHVARASDGPGGGARKRPLLPGRGSLRDAHGRGSLRGRHAGGRLHEARERAAAPPEGGQG